MPKIAYAPQAGQQMPQKYSFVGNNYRTYGEQKGFIYDPYSDQYYADPKARYDQYVSQGLVDPPAQAPKQTSPGQALLGMGIAAAAPKIAEYGGEQLSGLLGLGKGAKAAKDVVNSTSAVREAVGAGSSAINSGATAIQDLGNGTQLMSDGSIVGGQSLLSDGATVADAAKTGGGMLDALQGKPGGLFEVGGTAGNIAGGAGVGLGAYGAYEGIKSGNPLQAGLGGAGVAMGIGQLGYAMGPWGVAATVAVPAIAALIAKMGDKDMWKTEQKRLSRLRDDGIYVPDELIASMPKAGRSKEELVQLARETGGNVKFAQSRNEADLTAQDIIGYSSFAKNDPTWFQKPVEERLRIADEALKAGAVREHHGTIDVDWSKVNNAAPQPAPTNKGLLSL